MYAVAVHVASVTQSEIQITLEVVVDVVNALNTSDVGVDVRAPFAEAGFSRSQSASQASVDRLGKRMQALAPLIDALPELADDDAATRINEELTELTISPSIVDHDGVGAHMHWTPATARFDDQVMADVVMALAYELCDNGTIRFGRCGADGCGRLFYDGTRNRSRRFCADSRCASRTHTADHRARKKQA